MSRPAGGSPTTAELRRRVIELAPWHIDIDVNDELRTSAFLDAGRESLPSDVARDPAGVSFVSPGPGFKRKLGRIYPDGMEGRSFLDCACNCGAYCFWARELGAGRAFGFDVREHWIEQAEFLLANRAGVEGGMEFEVRDLYELPTRGLEPFDFTMFQGIFYHLPDPITGLKIAADLTREVLLLNTAIRPGEADGQLVLAEESRERVMSGVYGLNWFPTGPRVLERILNWLGFPETRVTMWRERSRAGDSSKYSLANPRETRTGRVEILASRHEGLLDRLEDLPGPTGSEGR